VTPILTRLTPSPAVVPAPPPPGAVQGCRPTTRPVAATNRRRRDLLWELRQIQKIADRLQDRLQVVCWRLEQIRNKGNEASDDGSDPPGWQSPVCWVTAFGTTTRFDGSVEVRMNGRSPFVLQPHLGVLLQILAEDTGVSGDDAVAFKRLRDIGIRIAKRTGSRAPNAQTLNKYICRLRQTLALKGLYNVIQTHRRLGRRLTLKRGAQMGTGVVVR
jgi:hypothetical protein